MPNYTVTRSEWEELEAMVATLDRAAGTLRLRILAMSGQHSDRKTENFLVDLMARVDLHPTLVPYYFHPQPEWTGGDSFKLREPHIVGTFPGYLPDETLDMAEASLFSAAL